MLYEEQERELEPEVEQERQVERPPAAKPRPHELHPKVLEFVRTSKITVTGGAFFRAFMSLANTIAVRHLNLEQFPRSLHVTQDFANTVMDSGIKDSKLDAFQRDVRWVLTSSPGNNRNMTEMVLVSPYEADQLIDRIRKGGPVRLHIYAPRQSNGFVPIDHLALYMVRSTDTQVHVPALLRTELNLFAGQLYFASYEEYTQMCDYLNLTWTPTREGASVCSDGFIEPRDRSTNDKHSGFQDTLVPFMRVLMGRILRQYGGIERTNVGKVLEGLLLSREDFAVGPLEQK